MANLYINDVPLSEKFLSEELKQFFIEEFPEKTNEVAYDDSSFTIDYLQLGTERAKRMFEIIISNLEKSMVSDSSDFWKGITESVNSYNDNTNFAKFFNNMFELFMNYDSCFLFFQLLCFFKTEGIDLMYIEKNGKMNVQTYYPFDVWVEYY